MVKVMPGHILPGYEFAKMENLGNRSNHIIRNDRIKMAAEQLENAHISGCNGLLILIQAQNH